MPRGGKRVAGEGKSIGRPKVQAERPEGAPNKQLASEILDSLKIPDHKWVKLHLPSKVTENGEPIPCQCEICLWRWHAKADRGALEYLWNRRDGKPVHIVNHLHDKPIEMNVNVKLSEIIRQVRERKREYERNR